MITINYWAVLVSAALSLVVGGVWYGMLFGKKWVELSGMDKMSTEEQEKMKKASVKLYLLQFAVSFFQVWVLAYYIAGWKDASGLENALWIWAGFVATTLAGTMWESGTAKVKWMKFLLLAGAQFITFAVYGLVLGMWK